MYCLENVCMRCAHAGGDGSRREEELQVVLRTIEGGEEGDGEVFMLWRSLLPQCQAERLPGVARGGEVQSDEPRVNLDAAGRYESGRAMATA